MHGNGAFYLLTARWKGCYVTISVQIPKSPFYSVRLGRKRVRCHRTTFWRQISARTSTFSVVFPYTVLKSFVPAVLSHFQKWANYFGWWIADLKYRVFPYRSANPDTVYYINLLQKPGTNIDEIDDFSSILVNCFELLDSHFECSRNRTVPVINLVQVCVVMCPDLTNCPELPNTLPGLVWFLWEMKTRNPKSVKFLIPDFSGRSLQLYVSFQFAKYIIQSHCRFLGPH